jgi:hypothetical protein
MWLIWTAAVIAAVGLTMVIACRPWLLRTRRFAAGRSTVAATVVGAVDAALTVRLPPSGTDYTISVTPQMTDTWRAVLTLGPPDEEDFEDPFGWNEISVSHGPGATPELMLSEQLERLKDRPVIACTVGALLALVGLLALIPHALLTVLGVASGLVCVGFAWTTGRSVFRTLRQPPPRHWRPTIVTVCLTLVVVIFLGATMVAAFG